MASVRSIACTSAADGHAQIFRVRDRVHLGWLARPTTYAERCDVPRHADVSPDAQRLTRARLRIGEAFQQADGIRG
ncbi:MAG: hypothetical protein ABW137_16460 [Mycobacterium sp.]